MKIVNDGLVILFIKYNNLNDGNVINININVGVIVYISFINVL